MEEDKIIASYDPVIMRRLLKFLRPYRHWVVLALLSLVAATLCELLLPVVLQRTLDQHVLAVWYRSAVAEIGNPELRALEFDENDIRISGFVYYRESRLNVLSAAARKAAKQSGLIEDEGWIVFERSEAADAVDGFPVNRAETFAAVLRSDLDRMSAADRKILRAGQIEGIRIQSRRYLALLLGVLLFSFFQVFLMARVGQEVMKDIRERILAHTMHQSLAFLNNNPLGSLVTRATNDVETINELFTTVSVSLLKDAGLMIGVIAALFALNARLAWITACTLPPVLILAAIFRVRARDAYRRVRMLVSRVNAFLSEHISGMYIVQIFGREKRSMQEFLERNTSLLKANLQEMYVMAIFRPTTQFLTVASTAVIVYFGARLFSAEIVTLGVLIAFIDLIKKFYQPVQDMAEKFTILQSAMAGGERVFHLLDRKTCIPDEAKEALPEPVKGAIRFENVRFAYKADEPVLRNLSFAIEPGENVAIVGYTGAGKTTIINLLTRMWDIDNGIITLDGRDLQQIPLDDLRRTIQPVQQDVFLFSGTIRENIILGSDITEEEMLRAAGVVNADEFIRELPDGYDTVLSEGATNISTGQRQLLSFARVLAHDPSVVILDEATSSIDTETEQLIQAGLAGLLKGRTSLVIAHRLSTIQNADRILVLGNGELLEQGSHQDLLAAKGVYYNLYKLQYEASRPGAR